MQSSRLLAQSGQSITEAVVATAILGITVVVALGTIDASIGGGRMAVRQAWAQCIVRETSGVIKQASWKPAREGYPSRDPNVRVEVLDFGSQTPIVQALQTVKVIATDPDNGHPLYTVSFLKANALAPASGMAPANLSSACPKP